MEKIGSFNHDCLVRKQDVIKIAEKKKFSSGFLKR